MSTFNSAIGEKVLIKIIFIHISEHKTTHSLALLPLIQRILYAQLDP